MITADPKGRFTEAYRSTEDSGVVAKLEPLIFFLSK